ncbi:hypothetical protein [Deinococcus sp. QL22]|uniref:hypothetical protein n=1 Tax=Deinococcus sp. QL22 TaxID=2939437 RepID=UPI002016F124|nr:hypothetical protein [Deinococcus sp. QL22]UQN10691.1 hypothetical protein M1R55_30430 [Deinococcus sp. QL22]
MFIVLGLAYLFLLGALGLGIWAAVRGVTRYHPRAMGAAVVGLFLPWILMGVYDFVSTEQSNYLTNSGVDTSVGYKNVPVSLSYTLIVRIPPDRSLVLGPGVTQEENPERPQLMYANEVAVRAERVYVRSEEGIGVIDRTKNTWQRLARTEFQELRDVSWITPQAYNKTYGPQPGPLYPAWKAVTQLCLPVLLLLYFAWVVNLRRLIVRAGRRPTAVADVPLTLKDG